MTWSGLEVIPHLKQSTFFMDIVNIKSTICSLQNCLEEYNAEVDGRCPGTIRSLKNSNAFMDIRGKWTTSFRNSRKYKNSWSHTYCFTASHIEAKMRVMKAGLSSWSMRHYRRCQKKQTKVRLKRLPKDVIDGVVSRNTKIDLNQIESSATGVVKIKNTARKSFPNGKRVNLSREDEKVIDELLADSSDEAESESKLAHMEPNNIVTFATGFATWTDKHDIKDSIIVQEDEIKIEAEALVPKSVKVPRPLPELQKIYVTSNTSLAQFQSPSQKQDIECVDLCSSDDEQ